MMLDPRRVREVFWQAVRYPKTSDRADILEWECKADSWLRQKVDVLLRAHDDHDRFLKTPGADLSTQGARSRPAGNAEPGSDRDQARP